jgi:hypothetical protein
MTHKYNYTDILDAGDWESLTKPILKEINRKFDLKYFMRLRRVIIITKAKLDESQIDDDRFLEVGTDIFAITFIAPETEIYDYIEQLKKINRLYYSQVDGGIVEIPAEVEFELKRPKAIANFYVKVAKMPTVST